jgi:protein-S-isoprenylcysteine O-methyltransferase Ste14
MEGPMADMLDSWNTLKDYLAADLLGGPRPFKAAWVINLQKAGTLPFVLGLMAVYDNWSTTAWVYAALHGSYGLCWLLKDRVYPDPNWEGRVTIPAAFMMWALVLGLYWIAPFLLISSGYEAAPAVLGGATILYALGVVLMMGSDAQKYFVLKAKRGLITDGFFARVRHPNYLGEMMLYASFAIVAGHLLPWLVLAWVWIGVFVPNMLRKERSMSRYPQWEAYKSRSGFLIPQPFGGQELPTEPQPAK